MVLSVFFGLCANCAVTAILTNKLWPAFSGVTLQQDGMELICQRRNDSSAHRDSFKRRTSYPIHRTALAWQGNKFLAGRLLSCNISRKVKTGFQAKRLTGSNLFPPLTFPVNLDDRFIFREEIPFEILLSFLLSFYNTHYHYRKLV